MSYPGGGYQPYPNTPNMGFAQPSPYPPAGGTPYPLQPAGPGYPASGQYQPYPPAGGAQYQPSGASPYPPSGASPYPPSGASPYPPSGASPYPPSGASPYPPSGTSSYPSAGGSPYPPAPGGYPGQATPGYPPGNAPGAYPSAQAPGYHPNPSAGAGYPPAGGAYPPAQGYPGSAPYGQQPIGGLGGPRGMPGHGGAHGMPGHGGPHGMPGHGGPHGMPSHGASAPPYQEIPTVRPFMPFDPNTDAALLKKAMKGFGTDEAAIINILSRRTSDQRQQISAKYQQAYGKDLIKALKSELSGNLEDVIIALMTPLPQFLAKEINSAISGIGTNERTLVEILCTRDNASIRVIKDAYYALYRKKIEDDLRGDTSGYFRRLLVSMCAANRDEFNHDYSIAPSLAQQLYHAGEGKMGTNEAEFNRILCCYSYPVLRQVFEEYRRLRGKTFGDALKAEFSGDILMGLEALYQSIENRPAYFARELHASMAGMGTKERALTRLVVTRSEIDMGNIKQEYVKLFKKPLEKDIQEDLSGDAKKVFLGLVSG